MFCKGLTEYFSDLMAFGWLFGFFHLIILRIERREMDQEEYNRKYVNLRILKSIQEYLSSDSDMPTAVYPIKVPDDLLYQVTGLEGAESTDKLIHHIFRLGLTLWSDKLYNDEFGSQQSLEEFIQLVKKRNQEWIWSPL